MNRVGLRGEGLFKLSQLKLEVSDSASSLISDYLLGLGSLGVAEDIKKDNMYEVSAYFPMETDIAQVIASLKEYLYILQDSIPDVVIGPITAVHIDQSSWQVWKSLLKKIRAGKND